jgi:dynein heavy chain
VFRDRLVNEEDRHWFDQLLEKHMEQWEVAFNDVCPFQPILYGDFMSPGSDVKSYELIVSESKVRGSRLVPFPWWVLFSLTPRTQVICNHH